MIGAARQNAFANESSGWAGVFASLNAGASISATTIVMVGSGGTSFGVPTPVAGMTVYFLDGTGEAPKLISSVSGSPNLTLTIPALTANHSLGAKILIEYAPATTLLLNKFSGKRDPKLWSPSPYSGTRAQDVSLSPGRLETSGSLEFDIRPSVNSQMLSKAVGQDKNVTGTVPGSPVSTTLNGTVLAGVTSIVVTLATGMTTSAPTNIIQIGTGATAECRKITNVATNTLTLDVPLTYGHTSGITVQVVIAPFIHTVPCAATNLDSIVLYDYVPYDDPSQPNNNYQTSNAYILPGVLFDKLSVDGKTTQGITASLDYMAQSREVIAQNQALTIPNEAVYVFSQEAVLLAGTANYRCESIKFDLNNNVQSRYTKDGQLKPFTLKAGLTQIKGEFMFYEDAATQATFWANFIASTVFAFVWTITDPATGYYVSFSFPKIVLEGWDDGDFGPGDLIDAKVPFRAQLDAGGTNTTMTMTIANGVYLAY
jgi:hypothetical protein